MSPPISPYEDGGAGALPTVVIVHGGFFKDKWSARNTQTASLVPFLLERGLAVGLVEYRRRGGVDAERPRLASTLRVHGVQSQCTECTLSARSARSPFSDSSAVLRRKIALL